MWISRPGSPARGPSRHLWDAHRALWAYERGLHHGPVFGEGNNHWYWSGLLDGVEAQFGQGWRDGQGTSAPLLVDFDLLKIHPLQLNHGMGYYERWWAQGPGAKRGLLSLLDQYRMQEVAYGHEGFLGGEAWHDPALSWLESHLMTPLTARTALADPVAIDYWVGGRGWTRRRRRRQARGLVPRPCALRQRSDRLGERRAIRPCSVGSVTPAAHTAGWRRGRA